VGRTCAFIRDKPTAVIIINHRFGDPAALIIMILLALARLLPVPLLLPLPMLMPFPILLPLPMLLPLLRLIVW